MVISEVTALDDYASGIVGPEALFRRLPDRLFSPLSSINRKAYWRLICKLYSDRFGPEADVPPMQGFLPKLIVRDIEAELSLMDLWEDEDGLATDTPLSIRANQIFQRLRECGWLRVEQFGVRDMVTMRREVVQFVGHLIDFATTEPVFISAKVRSIKSSLQAVLTGEAGGDSLGEAARQARALLEHIRNIGTNIHDLSVKIAAVTSTAHYVKAFFQDFIETRFIGDYRDLRTRDHPLAERAALIAMVDDLQASNEHRNRLVAWYRTNTCNDDEQKAIGMFERDIGRLLQFDRVDEYLERLDDEVRRANRRALAFLDYRLRSTRRLDLLLQQAIRAVIETKEAVTQSPFGEGDMISPDRFSQPRRVTEKAEPSSLRTAEISEEQRAKSRLRLRAQSARTINAPKLADYVRRELRGETSVRSDALSIESIQDVRAVQALMTLGLTMSSGSRRLQLSTMNLARGFKVTQIGAQEVTGAFLSGVPFVAERRSTTNIKATGEKA